MNQIEGASLKDAFKLMGQGSTKKPKVVDKSPAPRDDEPNDLNRINFEENIKYIDKPYTRFKGTKFQQNTFFIEDPNGNVLELKTFE